MGLFERKSGNTDVVWDLPPKLIQALAPDLDIGSLRLLDFVTIRIDRLAGLMNQQTRQMLSERFDLSFIEWQCLAFLGERGDLTAAEICRLTGYDKAQVSHALRDLAKRKLIHRATTTAKAVPIELTTDGRDLFKRCVTARRRLERAHLERLSPEQRVALYEALTILARSLGDESAERHKQPAKRA